jgi:hypothetical protein
MKKYQAITLSSLVVISIFASVLVSCNKEQSSLTQTTIPPKKKTRQNYVEVTIVRGIDLVLNGISFHCIAGGPICEFHLWIGNQHIGTGEYKGLLRKTSDGRLEGELLKENMDDEILSYFHDGIMEMPQDRVVEQSLIDAIGFDDDYAIPAGEYEYTETSTSFVVIF